MHISLSKAQSTKAIVDHIQEELSTEEFGALLIKLLKLYKQFQYADLEELLKDLRL